MTDQARTPGTGADPTTGSDPALDESTRSEAACPNCGAHRLALLTLPTIDTTGFRPLDEIYGMVTGPSLEEPGIGCLACGAEWPDLAAFNDAVAREPGSSLEPDAGT
ncbi:MAG TPA: hypothetical protein VKR24_06055 [Candidatus Limnocylindrales bacterium]|nr:hypothetical protein [Candidatus Limnocylindrales bacterium]